MKRSLLALSCWLLAPAAFAILDTNNNGLSDFWERDFNNGSLFDASFDPQADIDSDGWSNAQEAETGSNPFDPNPPDGMIHLITGHVPAEWSEPDEYNEVHPVTAEAVTVTWPTLAGKQYTLLFSPDLAEGSWLPVGSPFIAQGGETTYGFDISQADKCFWRVNVADVDSDYDGLTNYEELRAGTNPHLADSDSDTLSDWQEFMAGSNPLNQDTDGDGIPDPIDGAPLASAITFADADGDGIPDGADANPNDPRGPAPSVASENAAGNPLSNLIKDETVKLVLTVSNPAGAAPTASDLTFFLNGTEETTSITALGSPVGSSQRFLLTWVAETTANYPTLTLQNLTLRFRDTEQATSWLNLARIDVAEWEGKIITLPFVSSEESWGYEVMTHLSGMKEKQHFVARNEGANLVYRGPKTMKVINSDGGVTDLQLPDLAIPYLKISGSAGSPPNVLEQLDYATIATGMDVDFVFNNGSAKSIQFELNPAGINTTLSPGQSHFQGVSLANAALPLNTGAVIRYLDGSEWIPFISSIWPVASSAGTNSRILRSVNVITTAAGQLDLPGVTNFMGRDAKIIPHASGTLEYPGLPQESVTSAYQQRYMPIRTEEWRKIVIKIYPPQQHFTYSKGYRLNLGTGTTGDAAPQPGWTAQSQSGGTLTALTIPADGKIEILATDTNLYPQLTSPEGLVLFLKRDATVDLNHVLSLDILPIVETESPVRLGDLNLLPVEIAVDANRNGEVEFGTDKTSSDAPYEFWVNNDNDVGSDDEADDESVGIANYIDDDINDTRDLEDLARIQIRFAGFLDKLKSGEVQMVMKFRNGTVDGDPAINLFPHLDPEGGRDYVENESSANYHVEFADSIGDMPNPGRITKHFGYTFGTRFWEGVNGLYTEATESQPTRHLLFEGAGEGKGELVLEFRKGNEVIGEGASCWLNLKDIKKCYEEYTVAGIYGKSWQEINQIAPTGDTGDLSAAEEALYTSFELPEVFEYPSPEEDTPDYEKNYILFVHGWRMKPAEKYAFAETAFKRLWHRGYSGRFGTFSWPTEWTNRHSPAAVPEGIIWDPQNYDRSDRKAYMSGTALHALLHRLNGMYPGRVRMFAHSMGNVVASQAMRIEAIKSEPQEIIHSFAACQSASVAFAYDADNPRTMTADYIVTHPSTTGGTAWIEDTTVESPEIPEVYGHFPPNHPETKEYFTDIDEVVSGNIANVHNWSDSALAAWMVNQWQKPDNGWGYGGLFYYEKWWRQDLNGRQVLSLYSDAPEVFAHIAEAKSPALGASVEEGGFSTQKAIKQNLDTMTAFSEEQKFEGDDEDHSAQFRSINMRRWEFWDRLLRDRNFFHVQTDYPQGQ